MYGRLVPAMIRVPAAKAAGKRWCAGCWLLTKALDAGLKSNDLSFPWVQLKMASGRRGDWTSEG